MRTTYVIEDAAGEELDWGKDLETYARVPVIVDSVTYCCKGPDDEPTLIIRFKINHEGTWR